MLDYQFVAADRTENLVLGKLFVYFFMGEAGPAVPHTGVYYNDMRYIGPYVLKHGDSLVSPSKVEKSGTSLHYEYADRQGKTTRTVRLLYDGIEEEIWSDQSDGVSLELTPEFSDIFYVRDMISGNENARRWLFKQKTNFKIAKDCCEIDCVGANSRKPLYSMFVHSSGIREKNGRLSIEPRKRHFKVRISMQNKDLRKFDPSALYESFPKMNSGNIVLDSLYSNSTINLSNTLDRPYGNSFFPLGGSPWFHTIFGRDSTITALHSLLFDPRIARSTIVTLGNLIGKKFDRKTEEEPGRIIHEKRFGVLSGKNPPLSGYYGSIDATPLYVLTYLGYAKYHPEDKSAINSYRSTALKALRWIMSKVERDGLLGYSDGAMLANQAWKDSWDSVSHSDGELPPHPLYLVEVQGYAARALGDGSQIAEDDSEREEMQSLSKRLVNVIETKYWSERMKYFGEAIDGKGRLTEIVTSNPAHLLWMGVINREEAKKVAQVLLDEALLNSGYGVKTLSYKEVRHDTLGYHNGSVWPHDNMIALCGLANYGLDEEFSVLLSEMIRAYDAMGLRGLPELFTGERAEKIRRLDPMGAFPIPWADAGVCGVVQSMTGLRLENNGNVKDGAKILLSPVIPNWMNDLSLAGLYILGGRMNLEFHRKGERIESHYSFPMEPKLPVKVEVLEAGEPKLVSAN